MTTVVLYILGQDGGLKGGAEALAIETAKGERLPSGRASTASSSTRIRPQGITLLLLAIKLGVDGGGGGNVDVDCPEVAQKDSSTPSPPHLPLLSSWRHLPRLDQPPAISTREFGRATSAGRSRERA